MSSRVEPHRIAAADGYELGITVFEPAGPARCTVVINPATAVTQKLYAEMAAFLAENEARTITYDYRGVGASRPKALRGFPASMLDWARLDQHAVIDWAARQWPGSTICIVGHSFGGQALGLAPHSSVERAVLIAAQVGDYRIFEAKQGWRMRVIFGVLAPALIAAFGYFPGRRLGFGEDLPAQVMRQWGRWCLTPDYLFGDPRLRAAESFAAVATPLEVIHFDDDAYAPPAAVERLARAFTGAQVRRALIPAASVEGGRIGHFGFFRRSRCGRHWGRIPSFFMEQDTASA